MQRVLVTGGAGYVGSHACRALAEAGFVPVTFDNLSQGHRSFVKWGPLEVGNIGDRERLDRVLAEYEPVAVMHFAAHAYVGESVTNPGKYYVNNVARGLTLLEAAREAGIKMCVFSSSCATYGMPVRMPIIEDDPQVPINPYGQSKLMFEHILSDFEKAYGLRSIALRYCNAAGADPAGEIGELHDPETHLIPLVFEAAAGQRSHITIHGSDYATHDGTCVRDYVHVSDLALAHVEALRTLQSGGASCAYNVGTGRGFSVLEIVEAARRVTGRSIEVRYGPRRDGDPPYLVADPAKAMAELDWKPANSDLDQILRTAWHWYEDQLSGGKADR